MDVLWQDNGPSFLDASSPGVGGFVASLGDVGAPWFGSADGGGFSGQPVLWWDNGADSDAGRTGRFSLGAALEMDGVSNGRFEWIANGSDTFFDASALDGGVFWADAGSSTSSWLPYSGGAAQFDLGGSNPSPWQHLLGLSAAETWFHQATNLLWTSGTDAAPATLPTVDYAPLPNPISLGDVATQPFSLLAPQQLVWTDPFLGATTGPGPVIAAMPYTPSQGADPAVGSTPLGYSSEG
jgi:hypothetical protein